MKIMIQISVLGQSKWAMLLSWVLKPPVATVVKVWQTESNSPGSHHSQRPRKQIAVRPM